MLLEGDCPSPQWAPKQNPLWIRSSEHCSFGSFWKQYPGNKTANSSWAPVVEAGWASPSGAMELHAQCGSQMEKRRVEQMAHTGTTEKTMGWGRGWEFESSHAGGVLKLWNLDNKSNSWIYQMNFKKNFYWRIIVLQNFLVFCQTSTWISHRYFTLRVSLT